MEWGNVRRKGKSVYSEETWPEWGEWIEWGSVTTLGNSEYSKSCYNLEE